MTTPSARALITARHDAGLSQEELAARSGLSERTIRTLESGNAKRPHRDTLVAVARTLGMTDSGVTAFVARWRTTRRPVDELLDGRDPSVAVQQEISEQRAQVRERSVDMLVRMLDDRRWHSMTIRRRFEVVSGLVDRFTWVNGFNRQALDVDRFSVVDCVNIELGLSVDLPESGAVASVGMFGQTLQPGDTYSFEYTYDYASAYISGAEYTPDDNDVRFALPAALDRLLIEVRFAAGAVPRLVRTQEQPTLEGDISDGPVLTPTPFGIVQACFEPATAGVHGVRWEWD